MSIQRFGRMISTATDETLSAISDQLLLWLTPGASGPL
jgi:hypothetical protein